jgi:hypothetical protein
MYINKIVKINRLQCTDNIQNTSNSNTLHNNLSSVVILVLYVAL